MYTSNETIIMIVVVVGFIGAYLLIRYVFNAAANKGYDAVRNAHVRNKNANNPQKKERLADRYYGTPAGKSLNITAGPAAGSAGLTDRQADISVSPLNNTNEQVLFCPYCGKDMSHLEEDDHFCTNCGAQLK